MPTIEKEETSLVDTAVGPIVVKDATYSEYDIDDFVHDVTLAQGAQLNLYNAATNVDERFTSDRLPVNVGDKKVGGFTNV